MREIAAGRNLEEVDVIGYIVDGLDRDKNERLFLSGASNFNVLLVLLQRFQEMLNSPVYRMISMPVPKTNNQPSTGLHRGTSGGRSFTAEENLSVACGKPKRQPNRCFKCGDR